jgi:hypothetical protein
MVRHHHEWYDGTGYPDNLAGPQIPLGARVLAVVDTFDSMTSDRPYRKALSLDEAITRLEQCRGPTGWRFGRPMDRPGGGWRGVGERTSTRDESDAE